MDERKVNAIASFIGLFAMMLGVVFDSIPMALMGGFVFHASVTGQEKT